MQALEHLKSPDNPTDLESEESGSLYREDYQHSESKDTPASLTRPKYELTLSRKFEVYELCVIFFNNRYVGHIYTVTMSLYGFLLCWSFATVAGSAWATNIPFRHFGAAEVCADKAFLHRTLPAGGCLFAYYISLAIFAIIVVPFALLNLREQVFVQVALGLLRFLTLAGIISYCIVRLASGGDACREDMEVSNISRTVNTSLTLVVVRFSGKGWLVAVPVIVNAFLFHSGISSLTYPVEQKRFHHWLVVAVFVVSVVCYLALGVVVSLWFRSAIQETFTLNWVSYSLYIRSCVCLLGVYEICPFLG